MIPSALLALTLAPDLALAQSVDPADDPAQSAPTDPASEPAVRLDERGLLLTHGERSLELHLVAQMLATATESEGTWNGAATLRRARPFLRYNDDQYDLALLLHAELGQPGPPSLLDARLDWAPTERVQLAAGRMIVPYTRAWNTPLPLVVHGDRSVINTALSPGRRTGGYVYVNADRRVVEGWLGLYDPAVDRATLAPLAMARVQWNPLGGLPHDELTVLSGQAPTRLGVGLAGRAEPSPQANDPVRLSAAADASLVGGPARLDVEVALQDEGDVISLAGSALGAVTLVPERVILGARGSRVQRAQGLPGSVWLGEAFVNAHVLGPHLLAQLRYTLTLPDEGSQAHQLGLHTQAFF